MTPIMQYLSMIEKAIVEETNRKDIPGFEGTMGALENL